MSISRVRSLFENRGCAYVISFVMVVAVSIGLFAGFGLGGGGGAPVDQADTPAVASVGSEEIRAGVVEEVFNRQVANSPFGASLTPELQATFLASTLTQMIDQARIVAYARENRIDLSDAALVKVADAAFEESVAAERARLVAAGELKADATQAEFVEAIKKTTPNFDLEAERKRNTDQVTQGLADPASRPQMVAAIARQSLIEGIQKGLPADEESVKALFNEYVTKRIFISPEAAPEGSTQELAEKVLAEIKGGLSFETAMERYSKDTPEAGKSLKDSLTPIQGRSALSDPTLSPITKLKAGEVTDVIVSEANAVIYKLIEVKASVPDDFEKQKAMYTSQYRQARALGDLQTAVNAYKEANPVVWKSKGYELLFLVSEEQQKGRFAVGEARKARQARLRELVEQAKGAINEDPISQRAATLALFAANSLLYSEATPEEKSAMVDERLEAITILLTITESPQLRLEMVGLYLQKKDQIAGNELARAAEGNFDASPAGQQLYNEIAANLKKLQDAKLISPEDLARVEAAQKQWRELKIEYDKAEEEQRKAIEEAQKAAEAEQAAQKEAPKPRSEDDAPSGQ